MKKILSVVLAVAAMLTLLCSCNANKNDVIVSGSYTYVKLEDNTAKITKYNGAEELLALEIPSSIDDLTVSVIGADAFRDVQTIGAVTFPETIVLVEENAFAGSSIRKALLHRCSALTEIKSNAFAECHNLVQVDLPSGLTTIGERAFYYCDSLKVANFRGDTANIDDFAFDACHKVKIYAKSDLINVISFAKTNNIELSISEAK